MHTHTFDHLQILLRGPGHLIQAGPPQSLLCAHALRAPRSCVSRRAVRGRESSRV